MTAYTESQRPPSQKVNDRLHRKAHSVARRMPKAGGVDFYLDKEEKVDSRIVELSTGAAVNVIDVGRGDPLVLLHGVCMSTTFFERNLSSLSCQHRVVAVDFRGHGDSPPVRAGHTVAQYARDVRALLQRLDVRDPLVVGWSMGGLVIWDYLLQFGHDPQIVGAVIVSQGPSDFSQPGWPHGIADISGLRAIIEGLQDDFSGFFSEFVPSMFMDALSDAQQRTFIEAISKIEPTAGTTIFVDQTLRDYREYLSAMTVPHLLVWGQDEKVIARGSATWLAETLPDAELHVFDRSGHCPMWEEAERFNGLISDWSRRVRSRG